MALNPVPHRYHMEPRYRSHHLSGRYFLNSIRRRCAGQAFPGFRRSGVLGRAIGQVPLLHAEIEVVLPAFFLVAVTPAVGCKGASPRHDVPPLPRVRHFAITPSRNNSKPSSNGLHIVNAGTRLSLLPVRSITQSRSTIRRPYRQHFSEPG